MEQYPYYFYAGLIGVGVGIMLVLMLFQLFRQLFPYHPPVPPTAYQHYAPPTRHSDGGLIFVIILLGFALFFAFAHISRSGLPWPWETETTAAISKSEVRSRKAEGHAKTPISPFPFPISHFAIAANPSRREC